MKKRTRRTLLIVAAVLVMLAVAIFLRSKAPPEAARLLPESDGILYIHLRPLRGFLHKETRPPERVQEYQQFVDATGVDWERDLDEAAIALHHMDNPNGPNGPVAYSMVLVGKITGQRLKSWMEAHATTSESYAGHTVYSVPSDAGRMVRVAQIGYDTLAISNYPTPEKIHSMIDRHRSAALPFAGSSVLNQYYREVPLLSLAWGVGQIGRPFSENGKIQFFGLSLPIPENSTIIASLRFTGSVRLRVEEIAPNDEKATQQAATLATVVTLARSLTEQLGATPTNNGLKELLKNASVEQKHNRVITTATISPDALSQLGKETNLSPIPGSGSVTGK